MIIKGSELSQDDPNRGLIDDINRIFFHVENAYLVRRELYLHFNTAINDETAKAYLKTINLYKGFFMPVLQSTLSFYMIGLNQLVLSKDKKSLEKLVNKLMSNAQGSYLIDLNTLRANHMHTLTSIADMRMGYLAHAGDLDLNEIAPISDESYIKLFTDIKKFLNKINHEVFRNTQWYMDDRARESIHDTHNLMNALLRGESQRLSEIDVKYLSIEFETGRGTWLKS